MVDFAPDRRLPERPSFELESAFWREGFVAVAGVDEVGRGALAGPLYAAAVVFPACTGYQLDELRGALVAVRDSKQLSSAQRNACATQILDFAAAVAVAGVEADELDSVGVSAANRLAMERAVAGLSLAPDILLLDARTVDLAIPQIAPIKGDRLSLSIAAAAILAKVERDRIMTEYDAVFPHYGFGRHKGYGTPAHLQAISEYGPCAIHRRSFALAGRLAASTADAP